MYICIYIYLYSSLEKKFISIEIPKDTTILRGKNRELFLI